MNGAPLEAVGTDDGGLADPDAIATVDDVFARAIELAGATSFEFAVDPQGPEPISFRASDRSVEAAMRVLDVSENASAAVVGWDDVIRTAHQQRQIDPTTGAPTDLWFDPVPNGIDDELKVSVDVTPC